MLHRVVLLALDAVLPLDLGIPAQVFGYGGHYRVSLCACRPGPVATTAGFSVAAERGLDALKEADTVIVPGYWPHLDNVPTKALDALRAARRRGCRLVSICTGAFALAEAGILDGRRATTHWRYADDLRRRFPRVSVKPDVLYVDEGEVLTSAGVAAGLDLCLHLIRRDLGAAAANAMARRVVVAPHRDGGQAQYIERSVGEAGDSLSGARDWALAHLDERISLRQLAQHAHLSGRTLIRRFQAETGLTPLRWISQQRVLLARELLETTNLAMDEVARRSGLGSAANLRLHVRRELGTVPTGYRRAFGRE